MDSDLERDVATPWAEADFRVVFGSTRVEYDPVKDDANRKKHKYSLESAVHYLQRWLLPIPSPLFMTSDPFRENGEIRHNHMTLDEDGQVVYFVTTMRPNESVRVISLRSASGAERARYMAEAKAQGYQLG